MSNRYKGAVISATPPTTTGGESGTASGAWTLEQQMQLQAAGLWPIQPTGPYIEEVFSTYLYTGTGSPTGITVNNGIDLATKGGLLWCKNRTTGTTPHYLFDTARNFSYTNARSLNTASTAAQENQGTNYAKPETTGFSFGDGAGSTSPNKSGDAFASWTFRKQPKFFDVVTYTGNSTAGREIAHNLGSTPGCIIVKSATSGSAWIVYHRGVNGGTNPEQYQILLNSTNAQGGSAAWNSTAPTSTNFTVGTSNVNASGETYVAYLFAHDAGGFGLTGTDNVISCGSYTGNGTSNGPVVTLGYEPQWIMVKDTTNSGQDWVIQDVMRGMTVTAGEGVYLRANSDVADAANSYFTPLPTGFQPNQASAQANASGSTYIYIAIRRGPMRVPTDATKVFTPVAYSGNDVDRLLTAGFPIDMAMIGMRNDVTSGKVGVFDRLRGAVQVFTSQTSAESAAGGLQANPWDSMTDLKVSGGSGVTNFSPNTYINWNFRRAPSFFDEVCYTGTGSATTFSHNLTVVPELMIVKSRTVANSWLVYTSALGPTKNLTLNAVSGQATSATVWNDTAPTASVFTIGSAAAINTAASTNVAYLFATLAGVSKVGNYTGTGATQTINCGFTGGARFVLIKRTDNPGAWYVWDSARGMVSGTDPSLRLNSSAAEVNANSVYTITTGFQIVTTVDDINTAGGEYIFLAIA